MTDSKFIKNNQGFTCQNCQIRVKPHPTSNRNHCPNCLYCLHVDIYPGDRKNNCRGLMKPMGITHKKGEKQIVFQCLKCHKQVVNLVAPDDNPEKLLELSVQTLKLLK